MRPDRWEYGSEFHQLKEGELAGVIGTGVRALYPGATLWGSGRAALLGALEAGRPRGWERVFVPSYLCQEVTSALVAARWPVSVYIDHPFLRPAGLPATALTPRDVVLRLNTFGWRGVEEGERALAPAAVIEDHTHDPANPWARASRATLAFASLRKTFPLADGAVLWSPAGEPAPAPAGTTVEHAVAAELKSRGMHAKRLYLHGSGPGPAEHRFFFRAGEARMGASVPSGPHPDSLALLESLSPEALGVVRRRNLERITAAPGFPREWLARGEVPAGGHPFALVLDLGSAARRDRVLGRLVRHKVFPTILWPIARGGDRASRAIAARTLTLPCDLRYGEDDLGAVGALLAELARAEKARESGWLAGPRSLIDRLRG